LGTPSNVVVVKQESDFGVAGGGEIQLANDTIYQVSGAVVVNNTLVLPTLGTAMIKGNDYGIDKILSNVGAGLPTIKGLDFTIYTQYDVGLTSLTGLNKCYDLQSSNTALFGNGAKLGVYIEGSIIQGFAELGLFKNIRGSVNSRIFFLQNGKLQLDNCGGITFNASIFNNFFNSGQPYLEYVTNIIEGEISGVQFIATKGTSAINIDPAIAGTSAVAFGRVPYQGLVVSGAVSFVDIGGGQVRVIVEGGTSYENNDFVAIQLSGAYDTAATQITNVVPLFFLDPPTNSIPVGSFDITATFTVDTGQGQIFLLNAGLTGLEIVPFYKPDISGIITSIFDNGSGFARVQSASHGLTTGKSLFINSPSGDYDRGFFAVVIDTDNFDLLDNFGNPFPIATIESTGSWDSSSLDQTNNVVSTANSGGILPDSQILGNNILTSTVAFSATTILTRVTTGTWINDEAERFKATSDGRLVYTGRTSATVSFSAKAVVQRPSGTTATGFMNIMEKRVGAGSFTEIVNHPSSQNQVQSSNASQLTVAAIVENINPGDEFGIGIAGDSSFTLNILSIDFNIKK
jgi:hypothetical protein